MKLPEIWSSKYIILIYNDIVVSINLIGGALYLHTVLDTPGMVFSPVLTVRWQGGAKSSKAYS